MCIWKENSALHMQHADEQAEIRASYKSTSYNQGLVISVLGLEGKYRELVEVA